MTRHGISNGAPQRRAPARSRTLTRRRVVAGTLGAAGASALSAGLMRPGGGFADVVDLAAAQGGEPICAPVVWDRKNGLLSVVLVAGVDPGREAGGLAYAGGGVKCPGGGDGFSGRIPGPTLRVFPGDRLRIKLINHLSEAHQAGQASMTNLHVHGLHVSPLGIGDNVFVHVMPGMEFDFEYDIPGDHPTGLFWYHPHFHGQALEQVNMGLAGAILIAENPDEEENLKSSLLERGARYPGPAASERLLVFQNLGEDPPDTMRINGMVKPTIGIRRGEVQRWQLLNASARFFANLSVDGLLLTRVAVDGNWIPNYRELAPVKVLALGPAERAEVLITGPEEGEENEFIVRSYRTNPNWNRPIFDQDLDSGELSIIEDQLATLRIESGAASTPASTPDPVMPIACEHPTGDTDRTIIFTSTPTIDKKVFSEGRVDQSVDFGTTEIWKIVNENRARDGWHPFHLHVNDFDVLWTSDKRLERSFYQDTIPLPPAKPESEHDETIDEPCERDEVTGLCVGSVKICSRFVDFTGKFVYHCHFLDHEDMGMMSVVEVVKPVKIVASTLDLPMVPVTLGTTVVWTNEDRIPYTIAADNGSFNSDSVGPRQSFAYTFEVPGAVAYRCFAAGTDDDPTPDSVGLEGVIEVAAVRTVDITRGDNPGTIALHPPTITSPPISAGTTVVWTNRDSVPHSFSFTLEDGSFSSDPIEPGKTFEHSFLEAGTIRYEGDLSLMREALIEVKPPLPGTTVWIDPDRYSIEDVYIPPGTMVTWTNRSGVIRSISADIPASEPALNSGNLDPETLRDPENPTGPLIPGQRFSHRFEHLGVVGYTSAEAPPLAGRVHVVTPVEIIDFAFVPQTAEVPVGTPVSWVNRGQSVHTVTADDTAYAGNPSYTSDALASGDRFTQTFETPGIFTYRCAIHPSMTGTVIVG